MILRRPHLHPNRQARVVAQGGFWFVVDRNAEYVRCETESRQPVSYRWREEAQRHADRLNEEAGA